MNNFKEEELIETSKEISSIIGRCEKAQLKFSKGTSQYSLLTNRLKAMYISKSLIDNLVVSSSNEVKYTKDELVEAIKPITSIINKCETAKLKFDYESTFYKRFNKMIKIMNIAKSLIISEISQIN